MTKTKFTLSSTAVSLIVSAYFSFMLNIKFWQFAFEKIEIDSFSVLLLVLTLPFFIFVPLFWFFCLIVVPRAGKPLVMLLLVLSAASDYALQNLGIVINSDMIRNFVETNLREASDFLTLHAFFYVLIVGVLPAVLVARTKIVFSSFGTELRRRLTYFLLGLLTIGAIAAVEPLTFEDLRAAALGDFADFEDGVQHACALRCKADCIVTRNVKDFAPGSIPAISPQDFLEKFFR